MQGNVCTPAQLLQTILHTILNPTGERREGVTGLDCPFDSLRVIAADRAFSADVRRNRRQIPRLSYESAIALKIATSARVPAAEVAIFLQEKVSEYTGDVLLRTVDSRFSIKNLAHFTVCATSKGYLQFEFHSPAIATWLNEWIDVLAAHALDCDHPLIVDRPAFQEQSRSAGLAADPAGYNRLFPIQHAHARCCSLLRQAHADQWIKLSQPEADPYHWHCIDPSPIPWLTAEAQLYTQHPAERALISQLFTVFDELSDRRTQSSAAVIAQPPHQLIQIAADLAAAFQTLHQEMPRYGILSPASCEPFSTWQSSDRHRLQAHVALLLLTQRVLNTLLRAIGLTAPPEL